MFCVASLFKSYSLLAAKESLVCWGLANLTLTSSYGSLLWGIPCSTPTVTVVQGREGNLQELAIVVYSPKLHEEPRGSSICGKGGACACSRRVSRASVMQEHKQPHNWILLYIWKIWPFITKQADALLFSSFFCSSPVIIKL